MRIPDVKGKALITGASGFVGGRLREALVEQGADVVAVRRKGSPAAEAGRSVEGDYADVEGLARMMAEEKPDFVFHVAGVTKGRTYDDFRRGNVMPTQNVLEALERAHSKVKRFVHVSSLAAYGPSTLSRPVTESDPRKPIEYYGQSKLEAEQVVETQAGKVPWTIVRPAAVFGPRDVDFLNLFRSAVKGWNVYFGNRSRLMSIIYVDDCVRGILEAAVHTETAGRGYFLADETPVTWEEIQTEIVSAVPSNVRTLDLPEAFVKLGAVAGELATRIDRKPRLLNLQKAKMGAQEAWTCTHDAALRDFDFRTSTPLAEAVRRTHTWYHAHDWY